MTTRSLSLPRMLSHPRRGGHRAFTLMELLVVIGIIVILIGILIPVVAKVKKASEVADTQQVMSQLTNAINMYHGDFGAFPGPFLNDQIEAGTVASPTGILLETKNATGWVNSTPTTYYVTGSENLVLGLLGGLNYDTTSNNLGFVPSEVGLGPLNLNYTPGTSPTPGSFVNPHRSSPYLQVSTSGILQWSGADQGGNPVRLSQYDPTMASLTAFADAATQHSKDSIIPEFVDRFPSPGPMPILYLRARTGAKGIVSDDTSTDPVANASAKYQYDLRDITAYTNTSLGLLVKDNVNKNHNLVPSNTNATPNDIQFLGVSLAKAGAYTFPDAGPYFANPSLPANIPASMLPATDQNTNYYGSPRAIDQFILISAGPDGIYGTADDITSFGDLSP